MDTFLHFLIYKAFGEYTNAWTCVLVKLLTLLTAQSRLISLRSILVLSFCLCLGHPSDLFPSGFCNKTLYAAVPAPIHATCPTHLILCVLITWMMYGEQNRWWRCSLCSFLHSPVAPSSLGPIIFLSTLFSNTPSLCSSLSLRDQVSHLYKTTGRILFLCTSICIFVDTKQKTKDSGPNDGRHSLNSVCSSFCSGCSFDLLEVIKSILYCDAVHWQLQYNSTLYQFIDSCNTTVHYQFTDSCNTTVHYISSLTVAI